MADGIYGNHLQPIGRNRKVPSEVEVRESETIAMTHAVGTILDTLTGLAAPAAIRWSVYLWTEL